MVQTYDISVSDHMLIECELSLQNCDSRQKFITYRNFKHFDINEFNKDLYSIDFNYIYYIKDIDNKLEYFNDKITQLFNKHAPMRTIKIKHCVNSSIPSLMLILVYYKQLKNFANHAVDNEKRAYMNYVLNGTDVRKKWQALKIWVL
nr:unnamed protein product [Callosobruchus chinensis]